MRLLHFCACLSQQASQLVPSRHPYATWFYNKVLFSFPSLSHPKGLFGGFILKLPSHALFGVSHKSRAQSASGWKKVPWSSRRQQKGEGRRRSGGGEPGSLFHSLPRRCPACSLKLRHRDMSWIAPSLGCWISDRLGFSGIRGLQAAWIFLSPLSSLLLWAVQGNLLGWDVQWVWCAARGILDPCHLCHRKGKLQLRRGNSCKRWVRYNGSNNSPSDRWGGERIRSYILDRGELAKHILPASHARLSVRGVRNWVGEEWGVSGA